MPPKSQRHITHRGLAFVGGDGVWGSLLAPAVGFVAAALLMGRRFFALEPSAPVRLGTATAWLVAGVLVMLLSALLFSGLGIPAERAALAPFVGFFSLFIGLQCLGMAWLVRKRERSASE